MTGFPPPRLAARAPLPRGWWPTAIIVALGLIYLALQIGAVRPYLPPAGHGARIVGDPVLAGAGEARLLVARPPLLNETARGGHVQAVAVSGPAYDAGLREGDEVVPPERSSTGHGPDPVARILQWREAYWAGPGAPVPLTVRAAGGTRTYPRSRTRPKTAPCWRLLPGR